MALENAYVCGTMICDSCGKSKHVHYVIDDPRFGLSIGHKHINFHKLLPKGWNHYMGAFPGDFQTLCPDCNVIKDIIE
jgi:hypothetical protein